MAFSISRSSISWSWSAPISPRSRCARAALSAAGRSRLPTWSARNGGLLRGMGPLSRHPGEACPRAGGDGAPKHQPPNIGPPGMSALADTRTLDADLGYTRDRTRGDDTERDQSVHLTPPLRSLRRGQRRRLFLQHEVVPDLVERRGHGLAGRGFARRLLHEFDD